MRARAANPYDRLVACTLQPWQGFVAALAGWLNRYWSLYGIDNVNISGLKVFGCESTRNTLRVGSRLRHECAF